MWFITSWLLIAAVALLYCVLNRGHHDAMSESAGSRSLSLSKFRDPATVQQKNVRPDDNLVASHDQRSRCQIVYILGVEGTMHHGISPVLVELAKQQKDPTAGNPYHVQFESRYLRYGLFGWPEWVGRRFGFKELRPIDDPILIQKVISSICPDNGQQHVIIDGVSFPAGDDTSKTQLRVKRQIEWQTMSPAEISMSPTALEHPLNLDKFYNSYSPFADIRFVVLHRPHIETVASHPGFDSGPLVHSNVIQGFLLILSRFLDSHRRDAITGERIWSVFRTERLAVRFYGPPDKRENHASAFAARREITRDMADLLGWPQTECQHCFVTWEDSKKDYNAMFTAHEIGVLEQHAADVKAIWPPVNS